MKNVSKAIAFALAMIASSPTLAQNEPKSGIGNAVCRHLLDVDFQPNASSGQWVLGYVSGVVEGIRQATLAAYGQARPLPNHYEDHVILDVVKIDCQQNPDWHLWQATETIFKMMADRH